MHEGLVLCCDRDSRHATKSVLGTMSQKSNCGIHEDWVIRKTRTLVLHYLVSVEFSKTCGKTK